MKVGIDVSPLKTGHAGRGTGTYTKQLLEGLATYASDITVVEVSNGRFPADLDLIHIPYFDPYFLTLRLSQSIPVVVTVHDFIPIVYRQQMPPGIRGLLKWQIQKYKLKQAKHIITDSESSKKDIVTVLKCTTDTVSVVYLAPGKQFHPQSENEQKRIVKRYHLPDQYLLYVGDVNWNKNICGMIAACKHSPLPLVLTGKAFALNELPEVRSINRCIKINNMEQKILRIGYVEEKDLPAVYSAARLTLQVSYAEGFGLPVLESMACGTPCVVSSESSLQEIAGPSVTVDPWRTEAIATGITKALLQEKSQQSVLALDWVKTFTTEAMINKTVTVYKDMISS